MQGTMPLSTRASWNQSAITEKPVSSWQTAYQSLGPGVVAALPGGHEEPDRTTDRVGDGMELRVHPALRLPYQQTTPPFFDRRLEAVRCAFR